ncbi:hypothetical protein BT93_H0942 [Corymbia citriodora subsp. variegata]|nr:hypothetical protein BT93_H0942 [Corymbia citriodora subsp. variegata]
MNFFKSVFSDDPDPPRPARPDSPPEDDPSREGGEGAAAASPEPDRSSNSRWGGLGGLVKTLTTKSESVLETYRRDLQEFGLGLQKEIQVAHGSLENVGQAIDELGSSVVKGTAQIISQGKEVILAADLNPDPSDQGPGSAAGNGGHQSYARYSRLDAQVRAIRAEAGTFSEEPEDSEDYGGWKSGFRLGEKREEIERLMEEDGPVRGFYYRLVPGSIDGDKFWLRYFYRVHKLEQAENLRASLVKRAISSEEEELSWDVYDDDDDNVDGEKELKKGSRLSNVVSSAEAVRMDDDKDGNLGEAVKEEEDGSSEEEKEPASRMTGGVESKDTHGKETEDGADKEIGKSASDLHRTELDMEGSEERSEENRGGKAQVSPAPEVVGEKVENVGGEDGGKGVALVPNDGNVPEKDMHLEKVSDDANSRNSRSGPQEDSALNTTVEPGKSKESNPAAAPSNPPAAEEEDLGWDEIEDLSGIDDQRVAPGGTPSANRADLRKRLSVTEEDEEDLSWDIEDDDDDDKPATKA